MAIKKVLPTSNIKPTIGGNSALQAQNVRMQQARMGAAQTTGGQILANLLRLAGAARSTQPTNNSTSPTNTGNQSGGVIYDTTAGLGKKAKKKQITSSGKTTVTTGANTGGRNNSNSVNI